MSLLTDAAEAPGDFLLFVKTRLCEFKEIESNPLCADAAEAPGDFLLFVKTRLCEFKEIRVEFTMCGCCGSPGSAGFLPAGTKCDRLNCNHDKGTMFTFLVGQETLTSSSSNNSAAVYSCAGGCRKPAVAQFRKIHFDDAAERLLSSLAAGTTHPGGT